MSASIASDKAMQILATGPQSAVVECDDKCVICRRPSGTVESVAWSDLQIVLIQTTSDGPAADDLFWILLGKNTGCIVPSEAVGVETVLERLYKLPGFNFSACTEAMSCADDREFLCWSAENGKTRDTIPPGRTEGK